MRGGANTASWRSIGSEPSLTRWRLALNFTGSEAAEARSRKPSRDPENDSAPLQSGPRSFPLRRAGVSGVTQCSREVGDGHAGLGFDQAGSAGGSSSAGYAAAAVHQAGPAAPASWCEAARWEPGAKPDRAVLEGGGRDPGPDLWRADLHGPGRDSARPMGQYSGRLLLERCLPETRPIPVQLPIIDCAQDLVEAGSRLMAAARADSR